MRTHPWLNAALLAFTVAACGGNPPATQAPAQTASPTEAAPAESAPTGYAPDTLLSIIEGPLRVRSKPSVDADSEKFSPLLETGQRVYVISGPVQGSGYNWYLVRPVSKRVTQDGWISVAARDGTPWAEPAAVDCPAVPTLADISALDPALRILCYREKELTFTATLVWGGNCASLLFDTPDWMAGCLSTFKWGGKTSTVIVAIPPELKDAAGSHKQGDSMKATVTAHVDDPGAATCAPKAGAPGEPAIVAATVILDCRAMFVATSFEKQ
ncbi:MAG TPA: hypothetical protein VJ850_12485 [Candidatus Limnocylindrales bacterium]|nr:hypothetical protein [Candidatus Limnocylindrales bacterium]